MNIDATATTLRNSIAGSDLNALQTAVDAFGAATNPLATLIMNEVVRKSLSGSTEDALKEQS